MVTAETITGITRERKPTIVRRAILLHEACSQQGLEKFINGRDDKWKERRALVERKAECLNTFSMSPL